MSAGSQTTAGTPELELVGVEKIFESRRGTTHALTGIDFEIAREEFVALVGQSGCGKTTLLRILAGLIKPTKGEVRAAGRSLWDGNTRDRETTAKLGVVFQDPNLFPWYSVEDNIALPLKLRGVDKAGRRARAISTSGRARNSRTLHARSAASSTKMQDDEMNATRAE
jgi:NitT/TauT family transport system ATP-binding protein